MIKKFKLYDLKIFHTENGKVYKYLEKNKKYFKKPAEVYFSTVKKNKYKGWIKHKRNTCLIVCIAGRVKFEIKNNIDNKRVYKIELSPKKYKLLEIPPNNWFAFKGLSNESIIVNSIQTAHSSKETYKEIYKK